MLYYFKFADFIIMKIMAVVIVQGINKSLLKKILVKASLISCLIRKEFITYRRIVLAK